jgi:uncharacterized protein YcnI
VGLTCDVGCGNSSGRLRELAGTIGRFATTLLEPGDARPLSARPCQAIEERTSMRNSIGRAAGAAVGTAAVLTVFVVPAGAHVGTSIKEVPAGSSTPLGLTIGHGCSGSPTNAVSVQIPDGINNATAFAHAGWTITSEKQALTPPITSAHGEEVTERVAVINFKATAGNELAADVRDTFSINFTAPDTPGETLFFKTVQTCVSGSEDWIAEWDGSGTEPDNPAPSIKVVEASDDGGQGHGAEEADGRTAPRRRRRPPQRRRATTGTVATVTAPASPSSASSSARWAWPPAASPWLGAASRADGAGAGLRAVHRPGSQLELRRVRGGGGRLGPCWWAPSSNSSSRSSSPPRRRLAGGPRRRRRLDQRTACAPGPSSTRAPLCT